MTIRSVLALMRIALINPYLLGSPNLTSMEQQSNASKQLGQLEVTIIDEKKSSKLVVSGKFPTNGEKPRFAFENLGGFNPTILLLKLTFGELVTEGGTGVASPPPYEEVLTRRDQYTSVEVRDGDDRVLATAVVKQ